MSKMRENLPETRSQKIFKAKRRWQIALRRYVLMDHASAEYAPYFALDVNTLRQWFETQFDRGMSWDNFGKSWQFDHIIPLAYFDFDDESELKLCWNFTNLRVEPIQLNKARGNRVDVVGAKAYFRELYEKTQYPPCLGLLQKIDRIEVSELVSSQAQFDFITRHRDYLEMLENYSVFEFELLNSGRSIEEVNKEIALLKKMKIDPST
jgi:hypothetical protein